MAHRTGSPPGPAGIAGGHIRPVADGVAAGRLELRQLRFFVTVAEELHFGRAASREHIAPSALTTQLQRLERTLGVLLLDRTGRRISLTAAGARFLVEARRILEHVDRAAMVALGASRTPPTLRIGLLEEGYDATRPVLSALRAAHPDLEIRQVTAGVPEQCRLLADGRLDAGVGRVAGVPPAIASELFRLDPLGVLVPAGHRLAGRTVLPVAALRDETLLLPDEDLAPEFNEFVAAACRSAGFFPAVFPGSVQGLRAATDLVVQGRCLACLPASAVTPGDEVVWVPLERAVPCYPWSLLWRLANPSPQVASLVTTARRLSLANGWRSAPLHSAAIA